MFKLIVLWPCYNHDKNNLRGGILDWGRIKENCFHFKVSNVDKQIKSRCINVLDSRQIFLINMFDEIILMKLIDAYYCSEAGLFTRQSLSGCSLRIWLNSFIHFTPESSQNWNVWEEGETWKGVGIWLSTFMLFHAFHLNVSLIFDLCSYHRGFYDLIYVLIIEAFMIWFMFLS